jgi:hypothetical protein
MKMGFLLKNNARKGMGGNGGLKKGVRKECSKRERKRSAQKGGGKGVQKKGRGKGVQKKGRGKGGRKKASKIREF